MNLFNGTTKEFNIIEGFHLPRSDRNQTCCTSKVLNIYSYIIFLDTGSIIQ